MSNEFRDLLRRVSENSNLQTYNEDQTKQSIILPVLMHLGWSVFDAEEVYPEYGSGDLRRVDYALRIGDKNKVFVEVKRCGVDLEKHQEQLLVYAFQQGVPLAALTNGVVWWLYLPLREGVWDQRKFYTVDLGQRSADDAAARFADFLSKGNVATGASQRNAEAVITSREREREVGATLPKAWGDLLARPVPALVEVVKERVEQLCGYTPTDDEVSRYLGDRPGALPVPSDRPSVPAPSPGDTHTLDELSEMDLRGTKPTRLVVNGDRVEATNWSTVSVELVRWLRRRGDLRDGSLPVVTPGKGDRCFVNSDRTHLSPKLKGKWTEVDGAYVDVNFSSTDHVRNMLATLRHLNRDDLDVRVSLRS